MTKTVEIFLSHWGADITPSSESKKELSTLESTIQSPLPTAFKQLTHASHKLFCPAISSQISCRDLEMYDVQDFIALDEILRETHAHEQAGMPEGHLAFAYDCMGNVICFKKDELKKGVESVHIFDHTYNEMREVSENFEAWLKTFNDLIT